MLTVKHIIWNGDFETVYQAKEVRAKKHQRPDLPAGAPEPTMALEFVAFDLPNGDVMKVDHGKIFVMNENGKTVANYDFGWEPTAPAKPLIGQWQIPPGVSVGGLPMPVGATLPIHNAT